MLQNNRNSVRLTHIPTGITVECSEHRSQFQNRESCWKRLRGKLYMLSQQNLLADDVLFSYDLSKTQETVLEDMSIRQSYKLTKDGNYEKIDQQMAQ